MKASTLLIGGAAAAAVYVFVLRSRSSTESTATADGPTGPASTTSPGSTQVTARRVVAQVEDKSRFAPFPFDLILQTVAKLIGHRMDR